MADLIPSNNAQQEVAKQVEAIAEAAAQRDSQIAQMLNLVPKAAALSAAAASAIDFTKKTWIDEPTNGTPITAADMNRLEQAIVDLNTTLTSVQDSLSRTEAEITGCVAERAAGVVVLNAKNISLQPGTWRQLGNLPSGFAPHDARIGTIEYNGSSGYIQVTTDGSVVAYASSAGDFSGQVAYVV